jgi:hypothetical protein
MHVTDYISNFFLGLANCFGQPGCAFKLTDLYIINSLKDDESGKITACG